MTQEVAYCPQQTVPRAQVVKPDVAALRLHWTNWEAEAQAIKRLGTPLQMLAGTVVTEGAWVVTTTAALVVVTTAAAVVVVTTTAEAEDVVTTAASLQELSPGLTQPRTPPVPQQTVFP